MKVDLLIPFIILFFAFIYVAIVNLRLNKSVSDLLEDNIELRTSLVILRYQLEHLKEVAYEEDDPDQEIQGDDGGDGTVPSLFED